MKPKKDKSLFLETFGDNPQLRVFDFLLGNFFLDFPMTEIARGSNVSYSSLKSFFNDLIKKGFILKTRRVGKSDFYKLNTDSFLVKFLQSFDWFLTEKALIPNDIKAHLQTGIIHQQQFQKQPELIMR